MSEAMKPCPFCAAVGIRQSVDATQGDKWGAAQCCECNATGPEVRTNYEPFESWIDDAIVEWNRRAASPAVPAPTPLSDGMLEEAARIVEESMSTRIAVQRIRAMKSAPALPASVPSGAVPVPPRSFDRRSVPIRTVGDLQAMLNGYPDDAPILAEVVGTESANAWMMELHATDCAATGFKWNPNPLGLTMTHFRLTHLPKDFPLQGSGAVSQEVTPEMVERALMSDYCSRHGEGDVGAFSCADCVRNALVAALSAERGDR